MMTTPATAIKNEIRQLINLHIEIFRGPSPSHLLNWKKTAVEPSASVRQELDRIRLRTITDEHFRKAS